jgi:hypothetical protein
MSTHANLTRTQQSWDGIAAGDFNPAIEQLAEDVVIENGPGAGLWRHLEGRDALIGMMMEFLPVFGETWAQKGTCIYADDNKSICLVHERGTTPAGDEFDNMASTSAVSGPMAKWTGSGRSTSTPRPWRRSGSATRSRQRARLRARNRHNSTPQHG